MNTKLENLLCPFITKLTKLMYYIVNYINLSILTINRFFCNILSCIKSLNYFF